MHRDLPARRQHGDRPGGRPARARRLRGAGALIAAAGLASIGLAGAPAAAASAAAAPSPGRAAPSPGRAVSATGRAVSATGRPVSAPGRAAPAAGGAAPAPGAAAPPSSAPGRRPTAPGPLSAQRSLAAPRVAKLARGVRQVCPVPSRAGQMQCMALIRTDTRHRLGAAPDQAVSGYGPADLQGAYDLAAVASAGGAGKTVAVVDAYNDPDAVGDLKAYRAHYGLSACNAGTGAGCVTKVNEQGASSPLPAANVSWAAEESVDLDMVSAICPNCHILLVEATTNGLGDLGIADNTAVSLGAVFVSDSWDGAEFPAESFYDNVYFNHPGVAISVASGNLGYGTGWPSASQYVTSVGGTTLNADPGSARGWAETVWDGTGAGCSAADPKPAWQTTDDTAPSGCLNRTENDVAAVANPKTGVAAYDTYHSPGWSVMGGTSVATPIITSVYALAGTPAPGTYPASYPYQSGSKAALNDVTSGSDGSCETGRQYLCHAGPGYDGPTGLGTPDGTAAFASTAAGDVVTLVDPGAQDEQAGTPVFLKVQALDSASGQTLSYSATGLPDGLSIGPANGDITGTLGSTAGTSTVKVTATDGTGATGSVTFTMVVVQSLTTGYDGVFGPVHVDLAGMCMDDAGNATKNGTKIQIWACNGNASQNWEFVPHGNPGGAGTLTINGKCLDIFDRGTANETKVQLFTCNSGANQQWLIDGSDGELFNPVSGRCLADPGGTKNGTQLWIFTCTGHPDQAWILPPSPVQSGVTGQCMKDPGGAAKNGTRIQISTCNGRASERWTMEPDGTLRINGKCLDVTGRSMLDGAVLQLYTCQSGSPANANQRWAVGSNGELFNLNSGRCLDDPGDSTVNGTVLVQEDCYGQAGEIWAVT